VADRAARGRLGFREERRLRRPAEFEAVRAEGRRCGDALFSATAKRNTLEHPRLGLAIALKIAGSGVARNRLRRTVRESFRLHQHELPAVDLVVSARPAAKAASSAELRASLASLWSKVTRQCAPS
jgi:ribonuclease P protein component